MTTQVDRELDDATRRIYDCAFPLEDARAQAEYGINSGVNKILIINSEIARDRARADRLRRRSPRVVGS